MLSSALSSSSGASEFHTVPQLLVAWYFHVQKVSETCVLRKLATSQNLTSAQQENTFLELCYCSQIILCSFLENSMNQYALVPLEFVVLLVRFNLRKTVSISKNRPLKYLSAHKIAAAE